MFRTLIEKERVAFAEGFANWEDAVRAAAQPLLRDKAIEEVYISDMISCIHTYGPYIVIAPDVAMPHAQGGKGVRETSVSFMKVNKAVHFSDSSEHDARLFFIVASVDNAAHLSMLQSLVEALSDEAFVAKLLDVQDINQLKQLVAEHCP
jgi:ascorbate PTS system EIIA or EIIAB component